VSEASIGGSRALASRRSGSDRICSAFRGERQCLAVRDASTDDTLGSSSKAGTRWTPRAAAAFWERLAARCENVSIGASAVGSVAAFRPLPVSAGKGSGASAGQDACAPQDRRTASSVLRCPGVIGSGGRPSGLPQLVHGKSFRNGTGRLSVVRAPGVTGNLARQSSAWDDQAPWDVPRSSREPAPSQQACVLHTPCLRQTSRPECDD
jgi:hypothetical protein